MIMYSPESPSFLAAKGKYEECRIAFHWLRGFEEEKELEDLLVTREELENVQTKTSFRKLLAIIKKKEFYKPILIMMHMSLMMQISGSLIFTTYSTVVIGLVLGPTVNAYFWMVFLDGQRTLLNAIVVFVMDRFKRRTMLFSIGCISVLSHISIAVYVYLRDNSIIEDHRWIPIVLVNLQFFTIAFGMIPIPSVIAGEIFPLQYRGFGGSINIFTLSLLSFTVLKSFPFLVDSFGIHGMYVLYGSLLMYSLVANWFLLPETKGKTLLEIEVELRGRKLTPDEAEETKSLQQNLRKLSTWSSRSMTVEL